MGKFLFQEFGTLGATFNINSDDGMARLLLLKFSLQIEGKKTELG